MEKQDSIEWIYTSKDNEELRERYDQWAEEYDEDIVTDHDYQGTRVTAEYVLRYVPTEAKILDVGAGTGLMGEVLASRGYNNQVAMDLSQGMLDLAQQKNVYQELRQMVLGETLYFPTDSFDAAVGTGVFTKAHAPASSFDEIVRIVKPGGFIIFTLNADSYKNAGFKEKFDALESEGKWKLVESSEEQELTTDSIFLHQIWVFQVQ